MGMGKFFNILICCFCFFCVDYMNIHVICDLCFMSFHTICIKHNNQLHALHSLIITHLIK